MEMKRNKKKKDFRFVAIKFVCIKIGWKLFLSCKKRRTHDTSKQQQRVSWQLVRRKPLSARPDKRPTLLNKKKKFRVFSSFLSISYSNLVLPYYNRGIVVRGVSYDGAVVAFVATSRHRYFAFSLSLFLQFMHIRNCVWVQITHELTCEHEHTIFDTEQYCESVSVVVSLTQRPKAKMNLQNSQHRNH